MIIGVMSDSHGDYQAIEQAVDTMGPVDLWLHAGDYCGDGDYLERYSGARTIAVAGNCDGLAAKCPVDEFVELNGVKLWVTHGHQCGVKFGTQDLIALARQYGVDVVIYGHTHIVEITRLNGLLVLNPGSVARPRFAPSTMLKLLLEGGQAEAKLIEIP